jgi:hypothetical protein
LIEFARDDRVRVSWHRVESIFKKVRERPGISVSADYTSERKQLLRGLKMTELEYPLNRDLQARASLSRFRARAVVDYVDLAIHAARPTNFHTIQARLREALGGPRKPWVEARDKGLGGAATRFWMRIQEPRTLSVLRDAVRGLEKLPLVTPPQVLAIETAVDFYSRAVDRHDLEAMVLRLKHSLSAVGSKELECAHLTEALSNVYRLSAHRTLLIEGEGVLWRIYLKETDSMKPIEDPNDHRARVEVRQWGTGIPVNLANLDGLSRFRFESLTPLFSFRQLITDEAFTVTPTTAAEAASRRRLDLATRRGHRELAPPSKRERRKHHRLTRADRDLKEHVRGALRDLTRRFNAEKPGTVSSMAR